MSHVALSFAVEAYIAYQESWEMQQIVANKTIGLFK
jgi:hypothetical protein